MLNLGLVSRRRALGFAGGGVLAAGLGTGVAAPAAEARDAAARRIGEAYLRAEGPTAARLLVASTFGTADVPADLSARIADDFRSGRTVILQGFLLSRNEVAACLFATGVRSA